MIGLRATRMLREGLARDKGGRLEERVGRLEGEIQQHLPHCNQVYA
jgi:hypothetical protein